MFYFLYPGCDRQQDEVSGLEGGKTDKVIEALKTRGLKIGISNLETKMIGKRKAEA